MPRQQVESVESLFDYAKDLLDQTIRKPNILSYGSKPYPEQERFHKCEKVGRYLAGGNRGGKTDAMVVEMIWWASDTHPYLKRPEKWGRGPLQLRCFVVDVSKGVEQIMLPKFKRWMPASMLIDGEWEKSWDAKNMILTFSNGSTIDFLTYGMGLEKMGGVPRHAIFFDEEPPRNIFNESMMRLADYDGFWVIAATPVEGMGWTYDLLWEPGINDPENPNTPGTFRLSADQNPYIQAEDLSRFGIAMDEEEQKMRFQGEFVARSGLVFPNFSEATHVVDLTDFFPDGKPPKHWEWYSSVDQGLNNPTAWTWHAVSPDGDIITFAEHYASNMIVDEHAAVVLQREAGWGYAPTIRVGDPAMLQRNGVTGTNYIQEYSRHGIYIGVEDLPREVMIGVEKMQQYFKVRPKTFWGEGKPKWVISSNCINTIRELKKLRWATYESSKKAYDMNRQEAIHKKDDHAFDSCRYFATLMPDLRPEVIVSTYEPLTPNSPPMSYGELIGRMAQDETITFVANEEPEYDWLLEDIGEYL